MRFVGRGHPAIRATHGKTLELSPDAEITARATCIVAVASAAEPPAPLAGRLSVTVGAGGHRFTLEADANPSWDAGGPAVIRRSPLRLPGTFATNATAAASDLPVELVLALQDPDAPVVVDVEARPDDRETVVLAYVDPAAATLPAPVRAEHHGADTVIAQDAGARRLVAPKAGTGPRVLVVATSGLPRNPRPDSRVETLGLGAALAAAAASPTGGPVVFADPGEGLHDTRDLRDLLRRTPASYRLVVATPAARLGALLDLAREIRGTSSCVVAQEYAPPVRFRDANLPNAAAPDLPSADDVAVCFDAAPEGSDVDPAVRAAVTALVADGVPTKTAARALAALTGWERRRAYDAVVDWPRG